MMITNARARRPWRRPTPTAMFIVLACLLVQAISATATATATPAKHARSTHGAATGARLLPPALKATAARKRQADRNLVARAKGVKRCIRANPKHPNRCRSARRALQRAGVKLTSLERQLARVAGSSGATASASASRSGRHGSGSALRAARVAPTLTVSGEKLSWNRVDDINTYVLLIRVPKEAVQYSVVTGISMTPPPVPGDTVSYSVRTSTEGSTWSAEKSITYAAAKEIEKLKAPEEVKITEKAPEEKKAPEEVKAPEKVNTQAAPELTVSGEKLVWNSIPGVTTYVLVTKVPGKTEQFSEVSGTSITPPAVPGVTVHYSVRTAVEGSALSPEVAITYPAAVAPVTPPVAPVTPASSTTLFGIGVSGWGSEEYADVASCCKIVRSDDPAASWAAVGIKEIYLDDGPESGEVKSISPSTQAAEAVAEVKANPDIYAYEVLNEPYGQWYYTNSRTAANQEAYGKIVAAIHEAFVANFGSSHPLVVATYGDDETNYIQHTPSSDYEAAYVHPYSQNTGGPGEANRALVETAHAYTGKPIIVSEVGWNDSQVSEAEQASRTTEFGEWAASTGYVSAVTFYNYRDGGGSEDFGYETTSGTKKPAWTNLTELSAKY